MRVTFEETLSRKEWLHKELMRSLTGDIIAKATEDHFYDVKLVINGIEVEPSFYNDLVNNIEEYVDAEAKLLIRKELSVAEEKVRKLSKSVDVAIRNIIEEFDLDVEDIDD